MDPKHHDTPKKAKIQGAIEFMEAKGIPFFKEDVFRHFGVSHNRGWQILRDSSRRHHNNSDTEEQRGRKCLISAKDLKELERII
jgi:hypothetical protein